MDHTIPTAVVQLLESNETWAVEQGGELDTAIRTLADIGSDGVEPEVAARSLAYVRFSTVIDVTQKLRDRCGIDALERPHSDMTIQRVHVTRAEVLRRTQLIEQVYGADHLDRVMELLEKTDA